MKNKLLLALALLFAFVFCGPVLAQSPDKPASATAAKPSAPVLLEEGDTAALEAAFAAREAAEAALTRLLESYFSRYGKDPKAWVLGKVPNRRDLWSFQPRPAEKTAEEKPPDKPAENK